MKKSGNAEKPGGAIMQRLRASNIKFQDMVPFIAFFVIFIFFSILSYDGRNGNIRMLTPYNLNLILDQSMLSIIIGSGVLFVVAQGSTDLSVGVNLALSGVVAMWVAHATGSAILLIPVSLAVGLIVGLFNGVIVSRFKVPSFMLTIAMLFGVRGLVNYIQVSIATQRLPESLAILNAPYIKIPMFLVILAVMAYVFEFTKIGRYSRAIGENETAARFVGIPVNRSKLIAFALSGLMAGVASVFSLVTIGSTSQQMGVFLEIRVIMAIFLGGVLVTGGSSAKFYKILLGSFSITMIVNGLAIIGKADSQVSQSVQGILLLLILAISIFVAGRAERKKPEDIG